MDIIPVKPSSGLANRFKSFAARISRRYAVSMVLDKIKRGEQGPYIVVNGEEFVSDRILRELAEAGVKAIKVYFDLDGNIIAEIYGKDPSSPLFFVKLVGVDSVDKVLSKLKDYARSVARDWLLRHRYSAYTSITMDSYNALKELGVSVRKAYVVVGHGKKGPIFAMYGYESTLYGKPYWVYYVAEPLVR